MDGPALKEGTSQLEALIQAVEDLRRRVAALERQSIAPSENAPIQFHATASEVAAPRDLSTGLLAGLGRLLLGIAGAYLLRAITEAGILPQLAGALIGFAYACAWLVSSVRISSTNRLMVGLQSLTAALIAGPLLWEATVRFHSLSATAAAACLALFIALGQALAWRRDLSAIAGVTALAGSATAIALIVATLNPVPFAIALSVAAAVVEIGACRDRALSLRWIVAAAADFCAFLLVYLSTRPHGLPEGYAPIPFAAAIAIQIALVGIYVASTTARTLIRGLPIAWFEIAQVAAIISLAAGSGVRLGANTAVGASCLAGGAFCYLALFAGRTGSRNFHAYATFALLLTIAGCGLLWSGVVLAVLWSLLAIAGTCLGEWRNKNTLRMHGAIYLIAAAASPPRAALLCAIAATLAYAAVLWIRGKPDAPVTERISAAILTALLCWSVVQLTPAGLRTVVISLIAIALASCGRRWDLQELIWVLYPWMAFGAAKLFVEDFPQSRPAALALSLLIYGATLIALPRLLRRARPPRATL